MQRLIRRSQTPRTLHAAQRKGGLLRRRNALRTVAKDPASDDDSVALAFQMRAVPKAALDTRVRALTETEIAELELATDEALGRIEYESDL